MHACACTCVHQQCTLENPSVHPVCTRVRALVACACACVYVCVCVRHMCVCVWVSRLSVWVCVSAVCMGMGTVCKHGRCSFTRFFQWRSRLILNSPTRCKTTGHAIEYQATLKNPDRATNPKLIYYYCCRLRLLLQSADCYLPAAGLPFAACNCYRLLLLPAAAACRCHLPGSACLMPPPPITPNSFPHIPSTPPTSGPAPGVSEGKCASVQTRRLGEGGTGEYEV